MSKKAVSNLVARAIDQIDRSRLVQLTVDLTNIPSPTKDVSLTDDGIWYYRFEGTGTVAAAAEGKFEVRRSEF